jgi:hypothetical protein
VCLDNPEWIHWRAATPLANPIYSLERIADYVRTCNSVRVPVTFNVDIDRTGLLSPTSLALLGNLKKLLP